MQMVLVNFAKKGQNSGKRPWPSQQWLCSRFHAAGLVTSPLGGCADSGARALMGCVLVRYDRLLHHSLARAELADGCLGLPEPSGCSLS